MTPLRALLLSTLLLPAVRPLPAQTGTEENLAALEASAERLYAEDDLEGAIALYRRLSTLHTDPNEQARMLVAAAWLEHYSGKWERAETSLYEALSIAPEYPFDAAYYSEDFVVLYRRSLQRVENDVRRKISDDVRAAVEAMEQDDLVGARRLLDAVLAVEPNEAAALYNLALLELRQGNAEQALAGLQRLLSLGETATGQPLPDDLKAQALNNLGLIYFDRGFFEDAERALGAAVELDQSNAKAWTNLGLSRRRLGDDRRAREALVRAYELQPDDAAVLNNLALSYLDAREWGEAMALLADGTTRHPEDPRLWLNLGLARRGAGETQQATASLSRALELDPENRGGHGVSASTYLALIELQQGNPQGAMEAARRTLSWEPENVDGLAYLGIAQQRLGDLDGARQSLEEAFRLDPTRPDTANNLGDVLFAAGDYEAAERAFEQALALRPDFETAERNLQLTRERLADGSAPPGSQQPPPKVASQQAVGATEAPSVAEKERPRKKSRDKEKARKKAAPSGETLSLGAVLVDDRHEPSGMRAARVERLESYGAASDAGLEVGDLVVRADSATIESAAQLSRLLSSLPAGGEIPLDLFRDGRLLRVQFRRE